MQPEQRRLYLQYDIASFVPEVWVRNNGRIRRFVSFREVDVIPCARFGRNGIEEMGHVKSVPFYQKIRIEVVRGWYV